MTYGPFETRKEANEFKKARGLKDYRVATSMLYREITLVPKDQ